MSFRLAGLVKSTYPESGFWFISFNHYVQFKELVWKKIRRDGFTDNIRSF